MKPNRSILITAMVLFAALASPAWLAAQRTRYTLVDLGAFGGPQSYLNMPDNYAPVLNDRGMVAAWADTTMHDKNQDFCFSEEPVGGTAPLQNDAIRRILRQRLGLLPNISPPSTPPEPSADSASGIPAAEQGTTQIGRSNAKFVGFDRGRSYISFRNPIELLAVRDALLTERRLPPLLRHIEMRVSRRKHKGWLRLRVAGKS